MTILENVLLAPYTTFGIGGPARYFAEATSEADVAEAIRWARDKQLKLFPLGGGSNLLVPDAGYDGLVLHVGLLGIQQSEERFYVGAGEDWDAFVDRTIAADCAGVECLAGIPGSVGGTPVQNVGAYGQEVSETVESVRAFDLKSQCFAELSNEQCGFRYRESIFNTTHRGRYIVTAVLFHLRANGAPTLRYADLQKRFASEERPSVAEVARAVREIRSTKGMVVKRGDVDTRSAGSYFKNPIVSSNALHAIAAAANVSPDAVSHWPAGEGKIKLAAAWLLEHAGFVKGYGSGPVRISSKHTLALTNCGGAAFADLMKMQDEIVEGVAQKFGIQLEREPVLLA